MASELKERVYFDLTKVDEDLNKRTKKLIELANKKELGEEVDLSMILKFSLTLLKESHIEQIQRLSLSAKDLLKLDHSTWMNKTGKELSLDEYLVMKLKIQ